jgi:hypothetical protein
MTISPTVARRFLVLRHLLAPPRSLPPEPASVLRVVDRLGSLQFDPLEVAGRNHDLALAARIAGYRRSWTDDLLYRERVLFEAYNKGLSILPTSELPWYRITWDRADRAHGRAAFVEHARLVAELMERVRREGPLSTRETGPGETIDWYWGPTSQVRAVLEALAEAGRLGIARRDGNRRIYDLTERLFPPDLLATRRPVHEQRRHKLLSRYRAHGLLGRSGRGELWTGVAPRNGHPDDPADPISRTTLLAELVDGGELVPLEIEGIRGTRHLLAGERAVLRQAEAEIAVSQPPGGHSPGVAFLAPLDPLAWDRDFLRALFGFDYVWEVYTPARRRRWGYYVLPLLFGDRLVGRIEPRFDRAGDRLVVLDLWWEAGFDPLAEPGFVPALAGALEAHAAFGNVHGVVLPRTRRHRALAAALRSLTGRSMAR